MQQPQLTVLIRLPEPPNRWAPAEKSMQLQLEQLDGEARRAKEVCEEMRQLKRSEYQSLDAELAVRRARRHVVLSVSAAETLRGSQALARQLAEEDDKLDPEMARLVQTTLSAAGHGELDASTQSAAQPQRAAVEHSPPPPPPSTVPSTATHSNSWGTLRGANNAFGGAFGGPASASS